MNTVAEYRDLLDSLRYAINGYKAAVGDAEQAREIEHLRYKWREVALLTIEPKRLKPRDHAKRDALWREAVEILSHYDSEQKLREEIGAEPVSAADNPALAECNDWLKRLKQF